MDLKKVVAVLKNSGVSNGHTLEYTSNFTQCGWSKTCNSINSPPPVSTLPLSRPHKPCLHIKGNTMALPGPTKLALGSEPGQTMAYCTWGLEPKDSVPKSSDPTHIQRSHQSSAITMTPAVASGSSGSCHYLFFIIIFGFLFFFNKMPFFPAH